MLPDVEIESLPKKSALYLYWKPVVFVAWCVFITFELCIGLDKLYSEVPLCPYSDDDFPNWYWYSLMGVLGGFVMILLTVVVKLVNIKSKRKVPLIVACNIVSMATIATFLSNFYNWGGVCIDTFNVASPAALWGEWLACGPILIFITVTIVEGPSLCAIDWYLMATFFFCIMTGFLIIIPSSRSMGAFWLTISVVTYVPLLYLPFYSEDDIDLTDVELQKLEIISERRQKRHRFSILLTILLPLYTVAYFFAFFGCIDEAITIVTYKILSVLTKGLFAILTMDFHVDLLLKAEKALVTEQRTDEARRSFMKYIFHEVRTPLNSLTVGVDLLSLSPCLHDVDREILTLIKSASECMAQTLDDVLTMQKIEEGKFELEIGAFSLYESIHRVANSLHGAIQNKGIVLHTNIDCHVPPMVMGDGNRIEHVVSNLLISAIDFTPKDKIIKLNLLTEYMEKFSKPKIAIVSICIDDEGLGISQSNLALLFNHTIHTRPSLLQSGQGSGLGLVICREIVRLHGGRIDVTSIVGLGSKFKIIIPFPVVGMNAELANVRCLDSRQSLFFNPDDTLVLSSSSRDFKCETIDLLLPPTRDHIGYNDCTNGIHIESSVPNIAFEELKDVEFNNVPLPHCQSPIEGWVQSLNILVVDDAESNRKMLVMLLKRKGLRTTLAEDGSVALKIVFAHMHKHKLILMDNLMPVMNGSDAARALRRAGYPYIIVGITGNVMDDDIREYVEAGADVVFAKPLRIETLNKLLMFIDINGPFTVLGKKLRLSEREGKMEWIPY